MLMSALDGLYSRISDLRDEAAVPDVAAGLSMATLAVLDERASCASKGRSVERDRAVRRTVAAFGRIQARLERESELASFDGGRKVGHQSGIAAAIRCAIEVREEFCDEAVELNAA